jgi:hypothetical protein
MHGSSAEIIGGVLSSLLIFLLAIEGRVAYAKCPGIPPGSSGPSYVGLLLDALTIAIPVVILFFLAKELFGFGKRSEKAESEVEGE